jgi:hypothetical protein
MVFSDATKQAMHVEEGKPAKGEPHLRIPGGGPLTALVVLVVVAVVALANLSRDEDADGARVRAEVVDQASCPFGGVFDNAVYYESKAKAFVGLQPKLGLGTGFNNFKDTFLDGTYGTAPANSFIPGGPTREDFCTCDCKGGPDGVVCVGYGGISFRYISLLVSPGADEALKCGPWTGQMMVEQCYQRPSFAEWCTLNAENQTVMDFLGDDSRQSPGGPLVWSVGATLSMTQDFVSGVYRQHYSEVSCQLAIDDEKDHNDKNKEDHQSCHSKCGSEGLYEEWLAYCKATAEDKDAGFSGWGK